MHRAGLFDSERGFWGRLDRRKYRLLCVAVCVLRMTKVQYSPVQHSMCNSRATESETGSYGQRIPTVDALAGNGVHYGEDRTPLLRLATVMVGANSR